MSARKSEITMPRLSDMMEEGTIARWLKHAGDEIKKRDQVQYSVLLYAQFANH